MLLGKTELAVEMLEELEDVDKLRTPMRAPFLSSDDDDEVIDMMGVLEYAVCSSSCNGAGQMDTSAGLLVACGHDSHHKRQVSRSIYPYSGFVEKGHVLAWIRPLSELPKSFRAGCLLQDKSVVGIKNDLTTWL